MKYIIKKDSNVKDEEIDKFNKTWVKNNSGKVIEVHFKNGKILKLGQKVKIENEIITIDGFDPSTNSIISDGSDYSADEFVSWFKDSKVKDSPASNVASEIKSKYPQIHIRQTAYKNDKESYIVLYLDNIPGKGYSGFSNDPRTNVAENFEKFLKYVLKKNGIEADGLHSGPNGYAIVAIHNDNPSIQIFQKFKDSLKSKDSKKDKFLKLINLVKLIKDNRIKDVKTNDSINDSYSKIVICPDMTLQEMKDYCDAWGSCEVYNTGVSGKYRLEGHDVDEVVEELKADGFIADSKLKDSEIDNLAKELSKEFNGEVSEKDIKQDLLNKDKQSIKILLSNLENMYMNSEDIVDKYKEKIYKITGIK